MTDIANMLAVGMPTAAVLFILQHTDFLVHIVNAVRKEPLYSYEDMLEYVAVKWGDTLTEWLSCPACLGFWVSLSVGASTGKLSISAVLGGLAVALVALGFMVKLLDG